MRSAVLALAAFVMIGCSDRSNSANPGSIVNYEAEGNLASFEPLECVSLSEVKNTNTPADLLPAVRACVDAGDFARASELYALAGVLGRFDTLRVADVSAHQAIAVLQMNSLGSLPQERAQAFQEYLRESFEPQSSSFAALCAKVAKTGPPAYEPIYMVQHGMGAFVDSEEPKTNAIDVAAAWAEALSGYLHCANGGA